MPNHHPPDDSGDPHPPSHASYHPSHGLHRHSEEILTQIKREFFGMDDLLSTLVNIVTGWMAHPELRRTPSVVNLWGMTGTGKSAVVRKMVEAFGLSDRTIWIDLARERSLEPAREQLAEHFTRGLPTAPILVLDGIHEARSLDGEGAELEMHGMDDVWRLFEGDLQEWAGRRAAGPAPPDQSTPPVPPHLILTLGSLDASCPPEMVLNREISADQYSESVKGLSSARLLRGLSGVFAPDQLARLGRRHLLVPPPGTSAYRTIVSRESERLCRCIADKTGVSARFDSTFVDRILVESLIPSLGVRPVVQMVSDLFLEQIVPLAIDSGASSLSLGADQEGFHASLVPENEVGSVEVVRIEAAGDSDPAAATSGVSSEMRAVVAVHEAGHALVSWIHEGYLPDRIHGDVTSPGSSGATIVEGVPDPVSLESAVRRIATLLGGLAAEQEIFGSEHVTRGSLLDIQSATQLARRFALDTRFAEILGVPSPTLRNGRSSGLSASHGEEDQMEQASEAILRESISRATRVLRDHLPLLESLARELLEQPILHRRDLLRISERVMGESPVPSPISYVDMLFREESKPQLCLLQAR